MVIGRGTLLVGLGVVIVDQIAKHIATAILSQNSGGDPSTFNGWLSLTYISNQGAAFGALVDTVALGLIGTFTALGHKPATVLRNL